MRTLTLILLVTLAGCAAASETHAPTAALECDDAGKCQQVALRCDTCAEFGDCAEGLYCDFNVGVCKTVGEKGRVCKADCTNDKASCAQLGRCSLVDGYCVALTREDCLLSDRCKLLGQCTAMEGDCWAANDEDCAMGFCCTGYGKCSVKTAPTTAPKGVCVKEP